MAFPEKIRVQVRRAAGFQCCRCHEIGVEAHHIVPSADGGPDTFDNAAPLCPSCHANFGDNPKKRKEITQMRDLWYEVVAEKWPTEGDRNERLNELALRADRGEDVMRETQAELKRLREQLPQNNEAVSPRQIIEGEVTATRLAEKVFANVKCSRCGTQIGLMSGRDTCPGCGAPLPQ
jgi:hypothetical protein